MCTSSHLLHRGDTGSQHPVPRSAGKTGSPHNLEKYRCPPAPRTGHLCMKVGTGRSSHPPGSETPWQLVNTNSCCN